MRFLICLAGVAVVHVIAAAVLMFRSRGAVKKTLVAILMLAMFVSASLALVRVFIVPQAPWNEARLASTIGLLKGYPLYVRPETGPIGCYLYGPFGALAFVPAALVSNSATVQMLLAAAMATAMFFVPAAWLLRRAAPLASTPAYLSALTCFAAITHNSASLSNTSTWIHVDAPALGFSACALAFAFGAPDTPRRNRIGATLCGAMAIWTKQTTLPLLVVLPLLSLFLHGRRAAVKEAAWIVGLIVAFGLVFACIFDWRAMVFEMLVEPSRHPWGDFWQVLTELWREVWPMLGLLILALFVRDGTSPQDAQGWMQRNGWCALLVTAIAMLPGGLVGWMKEGGSPNNAGLATYFLLLAACAAVAQCECPRLLRHRPDAANIGQLLIVLLAAELSIHAAFADHMLAWRIQLAMDPFNNGSEIAYRFERAHPGEAYFPWNPGAVLLASGKLYHFDYAAHDREIAGFSPTPDEVRRYLPPRMRYIAYPPQVVPSLEMMHLVRGYDRRVDVPELPKLLVYTRKDSE